MTRLIITALFALYTLNAYAAVKQESVEKLTDKEMCTEIVQIYISGELGKFSRNPITENHYKPKRVLKLEQRFAALVVEDTMRGKTCPGLSEFNDEGGIKI
ncbi:MAG: hypothetical protein ABGY43_09210 [bacterium]|jgi:hypothetical protein|nr:hypothetical protein [Pseudomonadales bacterium]